MCSHIQSVDSNSSRVCVSFWILPPNSSKLTGNEYKLSLLLIPIYSYCKCSLQNFRGFTSLLSLFPSLSLRIFFFLLIFVFLVLFWTCGLIYIKWNELSTVNYLHANNTYHFLTIHVAHIVCVVIKVIKL